MNSESEIFIQRLREAIEAARISQVDFCKQLNVSTTTAQRWLTGENFPRKKMDQIAGVLNVSVPWLLGASEVSEGYDSISMKLISKICERKIPESVLKMLAEWPEDRPWVELEIMPKSRKSKA